MIDRLLTNVIKEKIFSGKIIIILGARQVGKTTLISDIVDSADKKTLFLNGDESDIRAMLSDTTSTNLKTYFGNNKIIVIDEAQRIDNIGLTLKIIADSMKDRQIIVSGSSSFDLSNKLNEPLTGRKFQYYLYPLSFIEMVNYSSLIEEKRMLNHRLIFGYYPEVVTSEGNEREILNLLTESYLYKVILNIENMKKPALFEKLLQALALQIGNEVSFNEIRGIIGADKETVEKYIDLLEKSFVIFRLSSLSRNSRNEIKKGKKIYFYDTGIRNAIIKNFNPINLRSDVGHLWENFVIRERIKINHYNKRYANYFFWRTFNQNEVDFLEEREGKLFGYEFKWNTKKSYKLSRQFLEQYPESTIDIVTPDNFYEFLISR